MGIQKNNKKESMADDKKPTSIAANNEDTAELFEKAADNLLEAFLFLDRNKDTRIQTEELAPLLQKVGFGDVGSDGVQQIIEIFMITETEKWIYSSFANF